MSTIQRFEDILAWQRSRALANRVYELTNQGSFVRDFKLRDQINGSSGSIMDNIAEGFERDGTKEFRQFLSISKGSSGEVKSQLYRALDRKHITETEFKELYKESDEVGKMIGGLMRYLNKSEIRGNKFKEPAAFYETSKKIKTVSGDKKNNPKPKKSKLKPETRN
jgi:four helix bundle protein